jgi:hypothetical protein
LAPEWGRRAEAAGWGAEAGEVRALPGRDHGPGVGGGVVDEHRYAGVISSTPHGGAHRRDVVAAFGAGARQGAEAATLERLVDAWAPEREVGVAERLHPRAAVVPGNHLRRTLGPRPLEPVAHRVWMEAAGAIEGYRARWGVEGSSAEPLGVTRLAALPADRLADHLRTTRRIDEARVRLGWRPPRQAEIGLDLGR